MQNSLKIDTCFWGFEITPKFSETQVFQDIILYPSASGKIHSEYLLGLVYNHFGRPAKQSHERGGTSIIMWPSICLCHPTWYAFCLSDSGTGYKTQPSSLEDDCILLHFHWLEKRVRFFSLRTPYYSRSSLNTFHCPKNKQLLDNNVVCILVFANWLKQWCKFLSFCLEQVQSVKDSATLPCS